MAHPVWLNKYLKMKPELNKIFDDLEEYRLFCVRQGLLFNEGHLYKEHSPYGEFVKAQRGKEVKDHWKDAIAAGKR